jgi:superfamily II DNA or RNA helicase
MAPNDCALVFVSPDGLGLAEAAPAAPLRFDNVGDLGIRDALVLASRRIGHDACADLATRTRGSVLRPEQAKILDDFANFLRDVAGGPLADAVLPYGRIILPPRTGKTVLAAHLIARTGLATTFIVPTRTLVEQTVRELDTHAPGIPVGRFYGDSKTTVDHGVNVSTYQMLTAALEEGRLPAAIRASALVFADEGHRAMTARRMGVLKGAFDPAAVRVALTATPDYDDEIRRLARFFPSLIHEMSADEAQALGLLAPLGVWVAEVDVNASSVRLVAGDYETESLGRLMSSAPFFQAAQHFRYAGGNADRPCLIACTSRQQAYDLQQFLAAHRPPKRPEPALVLGSTPSTDREAILGRFATGAIDTIVQVGVLLEGWSSPHCKLLIDLAPSLSRVRATQKFFRVMTRLGDLEARIYMLIPAELPVMPILPMEVFAGSDPDRDLVGSLESDDDTGSASSEVQESDGCPVAGVSLRKRVVLTSRFAKPQLDPKAPDQIRNVLASCPDWDPAKPCSLSRFRWLFFHHELFVGRGDFLLRFVGAPRTAVGFATLVARLYPEVLAARLLGFEAHLVAFNDRWCSDDVALAEAILMEKAGVGEPAHELVACWEAMNRGHWPEPTDLCTWLLRADDRAAISSFLPQLRKRRRKILTRYFGLESRPAETAAEIAADLEISGGRVGQIVACGLHQLRHGIMREPDGTLRWRLVRSAYRVGIPSRPHSRWTRWERETFGDE